MSEVSKTTRKKPASSSAASRKGRDANGEEKKENVLVLWKKYKDNPGNKQYREQIILRYLHLVRYVVSRLPVSLPTSIAHEDLVSYGTMGLMEAVERYDLSRGLKFETYAVTRIRGAIIDQLRFQDWVPRGVRKRSKNLGEAMARLEEKNGRPPNEDELCQELGVTKARLKTMVAESNNLLISLDEHRGSDDSSGTGSLMDLVEDMNSPDPEADMEAVELKKRLANAIGKLPEREKLLIALYYHENMTLKEIGEVINVSESRVCQLHAQAILRLRGNLNT
jgi:RNA polymerase sigma factor for flagellar operon FliA